MATKNWAWAALPLLLIAVALCTIPGNWPGFRGWTFVGVAALLAINLMIVGYLVNGRPAGAFIDSRNRLSLSKLQAAAWTVIVLAAFATAAASNAVAPGSTTTRSRRSRSPFRASCCWRWGSRPPRWWPRRRCSA